MGCKIPLEDMGQPPGEHLLIHLLKMHSLSLGSVPGTVCQCWEYTPESYMISRDVYSKTGNSPLNRQQCTACARLLVPQDNIGSICSQRMQLESHRANIRMMAKGEMLRSHGIIFRMSPALSRNVFPCSFSFFQASFGVLHFFTKLSITGTTSVKCSPIFPWATSVDCCITLIPIL